MGSGTSSGANEVGIYSHDAGAATYDVDNVVATVPEPASWTVMGAGVALRLVRRCKSKVRRTLPVQRL